MQISNHTTYFTLLLSTIAGFCDTVTFVAAKQMFSAHVTGNFIVFAYNIIKHAQSDAWLNLLSFPTFIAAVIVGGRIAGTSTNRYRLLLTEGVLLIACGCGAYLMMLLGYSQMDLTNWFLGLLVVFAMGLQNAFGKLFSKDTYGPTTMMTGNVTQAALDLGNMFKGGFTALGVKESFSHQAITIGGFLTGCLIGSVAGKEIGMIAIIIPGFALVFLVMRNNVQEDKI
jgi:uncharacterized membrane protein YoaK (UPF0700 family)